MESILVTQRPAENSLDTDLAREQAGVSLRGAEEKEAYRAGTDSGRDP